MADRRAASCFKTISCSHWLPEKKNKKIKSLLLLLFLLALANQDERGRSSSPGARSLVRSPLVIIFFSFGKAIVNIMILIIIKSNQLTPTLV